MPIIVEPPKEPTDLVIAGEEMRISAVDTAINMGFALAGLSSIVVDEDAYPPMNTFVEGNRLAIRRLKNGALMIRSGAGIATPCGAWIWLDYTPLINPMLWHTGRWAIVDQTQDNAGAPLGDCQVTVLEVGRLAIGEAPVVAQTISDGSGNYTVQVPLNTAYQVIAYKDGVPDLAGISVNTVTPTQV